MQSHLCQPPFPKKSKELLLHILVERPFSVKMEISRTSQQVSFHGCENRALLSTSGIWARCPISCIPMSLWAWSAASVVFLIFLPNDKLHAFQTSGLSKLKGFTYDTSMIFALLCNRKHCEKDAMPHFLLFPSLSHNFLKGFFSKGH